MSARKRRVKRKIAMLVRMDRDYYHIKPVDFTVELFQTRVANMQALARRLAAMGQKDRSLLAMEAARRKRGQCVL